MEERKAPVTGKEPEQARPRTCIAIDLKSFYASVECMERGLDPLTTNLVVADASRTSKTICLAVSPSLKSLGIPGRPRLFEVEQKVEAENRRRASLRGTPLPPVTYITAPPRMHLYEEYSTRIYQIYLQYVAPEDIHVYSIDEVFMDVTDYLRTYGKTPHELAMLMIRDVLAQTGITATAGIGTNLYLAKIAMDIVAKHVPADADGVRIADLDEMSYRRLLWTHRPITDFWRVGKGYSKKLASVGLYTMGDIARCSLGKPGDFHNEDLLYRLFGVNAELLIDHAWGWEPATIAHIKAYRPASESFTSGQVLPEAYTASKCRVVVREMAETMALQLVEKGLAAGKVVLTLGYDRESDLSRYTGEMSTDWYGRTVPAHARGTGDLGGRTNSAREIVDVTLALYDRIIDSSLLVRRIYLNVIDIGQSEEKGGHWEQMTLFADTQEQEKKQKEKAREESMQKAVLALQKKFGKNAVLKGTDLQEGATRIARNGQVGGHRAD